MERLADVAGGRSDASETVSVRSARSQYPIHPSQFPPQVRELVESVPSFQKRMPRLLRSTHIRALSGSSGAVAVDLMLSPTAAAGEVRV